MFAQLQVIRTHELKSLNQAQWVITQRNINPWLFTLLLDGDPDNHSRVHEGILFTNYEVLEYCQYQDQAFIWSATNTPLAVNSRFLRVVVQQGAIFTRGKNKGLDIYTGQKERIRE